MGFRKRSIGSSKKNIHEQNKIDSGGSIKQGGITNLIKKVNKLVWQRGLGYEWIIKK